MRSPLALLLVFHYLLTVVLGGVWAMQARDEAPTAAHPYVHSVLCQTHNYLRLDCFDSCNGEQSAGILKKLTAGGDGPASSPQSIEAKISLDDHVVAGPVLIPVRPRYARALRSTRLLPPVAVAPGVFSVESPPPKVLPALAG